MSHYILTPEARAGMEQEHAAEVGRVLAQFGPDRNTNPRALRNVVAGFLRGIEHVGTSLALDSLPKVTVANTEDWLAKPNIKPNIDVIGVFVFALPVLLDSDISISQQNFLQLATYDQAQKHTCEIPFLNDSFSLTPRQYAELVGIATMTAIDEGVTGQIIHSVFPQYLQKKVYDMANEYFLTTYKRPLDTMKLMPKNPLRRQAA